MLVKASNWRGTSFWSKLEKNALTPEAFLLGGAKRLRPGRWLRSILVSFTFRSSSTSDSLSLYASKVPVGLAWLSTTRRIGGLESGCFEESPVKIRGRTIREWRKDEEEVLFVGGIFSKRPLSSSLSELSDEYWCSFGGDLESVKLRTFRLVLLGVTWLMTAACFFFNCLLTSYKKVGYISFAIKR